MLTLVLATALSTTPVHAPVRTDLFQARLDTHVGALVPGLAQGSIAGGVSNVVSGSVLLAVGIPFVVLGVWALANVPTIQDEKFALVSTILGWTSVGFGGVLMLVGIPLLITGIVRLATPPGRVQLGLDRRGQLAVTF